VSPAQVAFLAGLAVVGALIVAYAAYVLVGARRAVGGGTPLVARLGRPSTSRLELHRWAFYAHRISGVAILAFLALHLVDVGLIAISPGLYDEVHALYGSPPMRLFEVALLAAILWHTFNGLRLLALDLVDAGARTSERLLWLAVAATIALTIPAAVVILRPVVA
jgi:succinate dehydrogenase / fumarate reductase, cytochrome b subunit